MVEKAEVDELQGVYKEMDYEGRMEMLKMGKKFLDVQKIIDDEKSTLKKSNEIEQPVKS